MSDAIATPFATTTERVRAEWIDHNGHMNIGFYLVAFDNATYPFFEFLGLTPAYRKRERSTTFALESHLHFLREVKEGDLLRFEARLLDHDAKRIHFYQEMFHAGEGYLAASFEGLSTNISLATRRSAPMAPDQQARLAAIRAAHAVLPRPARIGHVISAHPPKRA